MLLVNLSWTEIYDIFNISINFRIEIILYLII